LLSSGDTKTYFARAPLHTHLSPRYLSKVIEQRHAVSLCPDADFPAHALTRPRQS